MELNEINHLDVKVANVSTKGGPEQMDTQELPRELLRAIEKLDKTDERAERDFGWGSTSRGQVITKRYIGELTDAFTTALNEPINNSKREADFVRLIRELPVEVLALSALQTCLHTVATDKTLVFAVLALGAGIMHECWAHALTEHSPTLARKVAKEAQKRSSLTYRRQAARASAARAGFRQRFWARDLQATAGGWMLKVVTQALPDVFTITVKEGTTERVLGVEDGVMDHADNLVAEGIMRRPYWLPMIAPPAPWTDWNKGGPADPRYFDNPTFIRSHHKETHAAVRHAIASGQMQPALDAVNALQAVAWTINQPVMNVIRECHSRGIEVKGLPPAQNLPVPEKLSDAAWEALDADAQLLRRRELGAIKEANRSFNGERLLFAEDMGTAEQMADAGRFWTPMNCDWRGRVYGMSHFNFQREDRIRAMFLFADGEPIGERGLYWLKVHLANCGDFDKISKRTFNERAAWTENFMETGLETIALNPLHGAARAVWTKADKPFLFLASCLELAAALRQGSAYVTRLPVAFDGSCSGLQHLSAMTRAGEGALVNLLPQELPQDVYATIAERVKSSVEDDLGREFFRKDPETKQMVHDPAPNIIAKQFLRFGIDRKLAKRNVMTFAYSSKKFGMGGQHQEDLMEPLALKVLKKQVAVHPFAPYHKGSPERPGKAARYIASKTYDSIKQVIRLPAEAMDFLQKIAKALAHEGKPVRWTSPVGIPWINRYHTPETRSVKLWLYDKGVKLRSEVTVAVGSEKEIDKEKAANGVAPNFVHACDAAHLLLVARAAAAEGITALATVHDSFGCLASRADRYRALIREQFVLMYETHDVLTEVLEQAKCDLTQANWDKLPVLPERGALNIKEVLNAEFAFS